MANLIHDIALNSVQRFRFTQKDVRIEGYETDKAKLTALIELFSRAEYNTRYVERPSGPHTVIDITSDQRNIVACNFDTDELITGWYALRSISYQPLDGKLTHYPYRISLYFIGTLAGYQLWYALEDADVITNDWGI